MKSLRRYRLAKVVTILLSAFLGPFGMFIGYSFGQGRYVVGSIALVVETLLVAFDSWLYLWLLERMTHDRG